MFNSDDLKQIESRGSSAAVVEQQIERFKKGFPWMKISAPATPQKGISVLTEKEADEAVRYYESAHVDGKCKFVPASGAASRMFKDLFAGLDSLKEGKGLAEGSPARRFVENIEKFAFYDKAIYGEASSTDGYMETVLEKTLKEEPLGYGSKPKGVIKFHRYADEVRTAFEEHLVEAQEYMRNADGTANIVVTISPEHEHLFRAVFDSVKEKYEKRFGVRYNVVFTYQDKATDTVAVDVNNNPFRTETDSLLFRPAGHGALIENLNEIDADVVFIKNIDNVVPRRLRDITVEYKQVIGGILIEVQRQIAEYVKMLESGNYTMEQVREVVSFMHNVLCTRYDETKKLEDSELVVYLLKKLHRPIRVCGVVKNDGEPGGGPYIAYNSDGTSSPQIMESAQFDKSKPEAVAMIKNGSHFNPVDLVCYIKDVDGAHFDLKKYVDPDTGLISEKSKSGVTIKALELPGLWNGSMSDWNTVFVEVPIETFNPVKTVNDLLRPQHQG